MNTSPSDTRQTEEQREERVERSADLAPPYSGAPAGKTPSASAPKANFFLRRPVLSMVLSIFIVLAGLLSIRALPVAQYPDIVPPEVIFTLFATSPKSVEFQSLSNNQKLVLLLLIIISENISEIVFGLF